MSTKNEEVVKTEVVVETPPAPKFEPAAGLGGASKEKVAPVVEAAAKDPPAARKSAKVGAEDDIPEDAELLELSPKALESRIARAGKAELRRRYGTDNHEEIKTKLERLTELESAEEARKLAALTEKEQLETQLKKERSLREDAERRVRITEDERVISKEDDRMTKLLSKYLDIDDEDDKEVVFKKLARHLKSEYTEEEMLKLKDSEVDKWAKKFAEANPRRARAVQIDVKKEPLNNGADTRERDGASVRSGNGSAQPNFSPSAENPMSAQQARQNARKLGYQY